MPCLERLRRPACSAPPRAAGKLRRLVTAEAARLGAVITIDLFATADNTIVPRFASLHSEPLTEWVDALSIALTAGGHKPRKARARAEEIVAGVQGAIVLARALDDQAAFARVLERLRRRAASPQA